MKVVTIPSCSVDVPNRELEWNMNCCICNAEMQGIKPSRNQARVRCYTCEKEAHS
jgi:hypothetical protein